MEMYEAPKVEVIEVEVEKGFAVSGGTEDYNPQALVIEINNLKTYTYEKDIVHIFSCSWIRNNRLFQ